MAGRERLPRIRSGIGQTALPRPDVVDQIKAAMLAGEFQFETVDGQILGWKDKRGRYYISDGHHRVVAALELYSETGDRSHLDRLLECGTWRTTPPSKPKAAHAQPLVAFSHNNWMVTAMNGDRMRSFVCHGLQIGETIVPAFTVGPGEIAKLVFPTGGEWEVDRVLIAILANRDSRIETSGPLATVELPTTRSPLREIFHRQTAAEWLMTRCALSRQEAQAGLNQVGVKPDVPISFLAGNPRWMIGFAAAMSARPAAVVFTTAFCDPMGMQQALATASARLGNAAGVYLTCDPDLEIDEPEYAATLMVAVKDQTMVA